MLLVFCAKVFKTLCMTEKKKILFAREEKELLLGLVQKYKHVESKESDVISKANIAKNQLVFQKRMQVLEEFLKEKRTLELHLLKNMLSTPNLFQTLIKIIYEKCLSMKAAFIAFPVRFSGNGGSCICNAGGSPSSSSNQRSPCMIPRLCKTTQAVIILKMLPILY
jgi:hypothetical protein